MGQTTDQIESDIHKTREDLRSNFMELENKVKSVADWRQHFRNHPGTLLAAAFGAGALLATMGRSSRSAGAPLPTASTRTPKEARPEPAGLGRQKHAILEIWGGIKSALVGVAALKIAGYLGELVPGNQEQLKKAEGTQKLPSSTQPF